LLPHSTHFIRQFLVFVLFISIIIIIIIIKSIMTLSGEMEIVWKEAVVAY